MAHDVSDDTKPKIGEILKRLRQDKLWSQAELAHLIGTTPVSVGRWEKNLTRPNLHFQQQLCQVFGKSPQELGFVPQPEHEKGSQSIGLETEPEQATLHERATSGLPLLAPASPTPLPSALIPRRAVVWQRKSLLFVITCLSLFLLLSTLFWFARQNMPSSTAHHPSCQAPSSHESATAIYAQVMCHHSLLTSALARQDALQWDENNQCIFTHGAYHALLSPTMYVAECFAHASPRLRNFALQVEITILKGYSGGLVFDAEGPSPNWDVVTSRLPIDIWGQYNFYLAGNNAPCHLIKDTIAPNYCHSPHGTITYGIGATNTMTVIAFGPLIYFYANGIFIDQAQAPASAPLTGFIGVFATGTRVNADVAFRHLQIWSI